MNTIRLSADGRFVEGWHNGQRIITVPVCLYGLHGAMGACLDHLRKWTGEEPTIDRELKRRLSDADAALQRLAFGGEWK